MSLVKHESMWSVRQLKSFAALAFRLGKTPSKFHDKIVHQVSVEIETLPVEVVVYCDGHCGTTQIYDIGAAMVVDGMLIERVKRSSYHSLEQAVSDCEKLAADQDALFGLLDG